MLVGEDRGGVINRLFKKSAVVEAKRLHLLSVSLDCVTLLFHLYKKCFEGIFHVLEIIRSWFHCS